MERTTEKNCKANEEREPLQVALFAEKDSECNIVANPPAIGWAVATKAEERRKYALGKEAGDVFKVVLRPEHMKKAQG
jgi:hypothetical protein